MDAKLSQKPEGFRTLSTGMVPLQPTPRMEKETHESSSAFWGAHATPTPKMMAEVYYLRRVFHVSLTSLAHLPCSASPSTPEFTCGPNDRNKTLAIRVSSGGSPDGVQKHYSWATRRALQG